MKEIKIDVDRRSEIMDILLYLSNYRKEYPNLILFNKDIKYVKDVFDHFNKFANHNAVSLLNEIIERHNFCYDAPFVLAMQLNEDLTVGELLEYPYKNRLKGDPIVLDFMNEIKDFADKSDFQGFYYAHKDYYNEIKNKAESNLDYSKVSKLQEFFKLDKDIELIINFLPLSSRGGAFYDYYRKNKFILNYQNDESGNFDVAVGSWFENAVFHLFSTCLVRSYVDEKEIEIPQAKEYEKMIKENYVSYPNIGFICEEIARVLRVLINEVYGKVSAEEGLKKMFFRNRERASQILEILQEWQKSNGKLNEYLQRIFNLY